MLCWSYDRIYARYVILQILNIIPYQGYIIPLESSCFLAYYSNTTNSTFWSPFQTMQLHSFFCSFVNHRGLLYYGAPGLGISYGMCALNGRILIVQQKKGKRSYYPQTRVQVNAWINCVVMDGWMDTWMGKWRDGASGGCSVAAWCMYVFCIFSMYAYMCLCRYICLYVQIPGSEERKSLVSMCISVARSLWGWGGS